MVSPPRSFSCHGMRRATFRQDLYYRLNVIALYLPPLRERSDDIPLLVESFLQCLSGTRDGEQKTLSDEASEVIGTYQWPGNVRELENALERAWIMTPGDRIELNALPERVITPIPSRLTDDRSAPNPSVDGFDYREPPTIMGDPEGSGRGDPGAPGVNPKNRAKRRRRSPSLRFRHD